MSRTSLLDVDPYTPPATKVREVGHSDEVERDRREHLEVETNLISLGRLHFLGGFFAVPGSLLVLANSADSRTLAFAAAALGFGTLSFVSGFLLRRLSPRARGPATVTAAFGLLLFPLGTVIDGWLLFLLFSSKGRRVLSNGYREVVSSTPHVGHRASPLLWAILALLIAGLVAGFAFGPARP